MLWYCVCCSLSALIKIRNVLSGNVDNITYCEAIIGAGKILMVDCCFSLVLVPSHLEVEVFFLWWIVVLLSAACSGRLMTLSPVKMALCLV